MRIQSQTKTLNPNTRYSDMPPAILKTGYLQKAGDKGIRKAWKKRFFRLTSEALAYYHDDQESGPINAIPLRSIADVTPVSASPEAGAGDFNLEVPSQQRTFRLRAPDGARARDEWVAALRGAVGAAAAAQPDLGKTLSRSAMAEIATTGGAKDAAHELKAEKEKRAAAEREAQTCV